ncbi:MAG TPA: metal-dependent hydrolase [Methanotrichaceae archaeon]|nr:metal-dependent hydrolase [Methanotrichaceae archaeon]
MKSVCKLEKEIKDKVRGAAHHMDFFTHLLIGLLAASWAGGFNPNLYLAAGAIMSQLPDFDFIMFPVCRRFPIACHHGITHTLVFMIAASAVLYSAFFALTGVSDTWLLLLMLIVGSLHIFGDFMGTGGVPLLYPLSSKYFKLNIDLGINPPLSFISLAGIVVLLASRLNRAYFLDAGEVTTVLSALYVLYYASKAAIKLHLQRLPENRGFAALPTARPDIWRFASRRETRDAIEVAVKAKEGVRTYRIPKGYLEIIERCEDLPYTYWHPQVQAEMRFFEYPTYQTMCKDGRLEIIWNSAEMGKVMEVLVTCGRDGVCVRTQLRGKGS